MFYLFYIHIYIYEIYMFIYNVFKYGAGQGWRRSVGHILWKKNQEVVQRVKKESNILHTIKIRDAVWIGHIWRRNRHLKHVAERKTKEMTGRRGRRRKQLLDDLEEKRECWKFKMEALDRNLWRTRGYGPVVILRNEWMNERIYIYIYNIQGEFYQSLLKMH